MIAFPPTGEHSPVTPQSIFRFDDLKRHLCLFCLHPHFTMPTHPGSYDLAVTPRQDQSLPPFAHHHIIFLRLSQPDFHIHQVVRQSPPSAIAHDRSLALSSHRLTNETTLTICEGGHSPAAHRSQRRPSHTKAVPLSQASAPDNHKPNRQYARQ